MKIRTGGRGAGEDDRLIAKRDFPASHILQMKLFTHIASSASIVGSSLLIALPVNSAEYKIKLGGGSAYWGGHPSFAVVKTSSSNLVTIYQTTNTVDQLLGTGKWWDHKVTASRACIVEDTGWDNPDQCIIGEGGLIQIPVGNDPEDYTYEIKWKERGAVQHAKFGLKK